MESVSQIKRICVLVCMGLILIALIFVVFFTGLNNFSITGASHAGANIACALVMFAMCFTLTRGLYDKKKSLKIFIIFLIVVFVLCTADALAWIMNIYQPDVVTWEYVKAGVLVASHLCVIPLVFFNIEIIGGITKKNEFDFKVLAIIGFIYLAFLICFSTFGGYFSIEEGKLVCDNADMGMLLILSVIMDVFIGFILSKSKVPKKWSYVSLFHALLMMVLLFVCFLFDSPTILHTLLAAYLTFAYCTVFVEVGEGNKEFNKSFSKYLEDPSKTLVNTDLVENTKIAVVVCQMHNMRNLSNYFETAIVIDIYNSFLDKVNEITANHRGILMTPIGFEIKCIFKYGSSIDNQYVYDAIGAAKEILQATENINDSNRIKRYPSVYAGIAIDEGETFLGSVGGGGHIQYTASGEILNNCYFLESNCSEGEILISESVVEATEGNLHITDNRKIKLPNSDEYINAYRLGF